MGRFTDVLKSQLCSEKSKRNATTADSVGPTLILSIILRKALDRLNIATSGLEMCRGNRAYIHINIYRPYFISATQSTHKISTQKNN